MSTVNCYGRFYGKTDRCASCEVKEYCAEAGDPSLLTQKRSTTYLGAIEHREDLIEHPEDSGFREMRFSVDDVLVVLSFALAVTKAERKFLLAYLGLPRGAYTLASVARDLGWSRQRASAIFRRLRARGPQFEMLFPYVRGKVHGKLLG